MNEKPDLSQAVAGDVHRRLLANGSKSHGFAIDNHVVSIAAVIWVFTTGFRVPALNTTRQDRRLRTVALESEKDAMTSKTAAGAAPRIS
eukprot:239510-Rhodomonas_salina.1